jgi:hypothetical protein
MSELSEILRDLSVLVGGGKTPTLFTAQKSSAKLMHNYDVTDAVEQIIMYLPQATRGKALFDKYATPELLELWNASGAKHRNVCPHSTLGCRNTCLGYAGRLASPPTERAMLARYLMLCMYPKQFWELAHEEVGKHRTRVRKRGKQLVTRVNGTSELQVEHEPRELGVDLLGDYPDVWFQDYTKRPLIKSGWRTVVPNYYLVRSITERDGQQVFDEHEGNVVVPVNLGKDDPLPETFMGRPVIDGDKHDLRCLDHQISGVTNAAVLVRVKKRNDGRPAIDNGFIREVV